MTDNELRPQDVNDALQVWREAERRSIRAAALGEAADEAIDASRLAQEAARSTAAAAEAARASAEAALASATEASNAASAMADAADKVARSAFDDGALKHADEQDANTATEAARIAHSAAVERVEERYRRKDGLVDGS